MSFRFRFLIICISLTIVSDSFPKLLAAGSSQPLLQHRDALGDYKTDAPGIRRLIKGEDMPQPDTKASVDRGAHIVPRPNGAWPRVPAGFTVDLIATNLHNPRKIITAPNGDIFVAESSANRISIFREAPYNLEVGHATWTKNVFAEKLRQPFGIAFYPAGSQPKFVYIANTDSVIRFAYKDGDLKSTGEEEMIVPDIPGGGRLRGGGH